VASLFTFFDKLDAPLSEGSHHTGEAIMDINEEGEGTPRRITLKGGDAATFPAAGRAPTSAARMRQVSGALAASQNLSSDHAAKSGELDYRVRREKVVVHSGS
jgi:hypothetical protein